MAFPVVEATNHSVEPNDIISHTVSLPANIQAGETLLVFFVCDGNRAVTFPEGWTEIFETMNNCTLAIAWCKADGEEGASITVTTSTAKQSAHISYRISGAIDPTVTPPEVSTGATGVSANPNPDSLTAGGGSKEYLWISVAGSDDGRDLYIAYPANYINGEGYQSKEDSDGCNIGVARRDLETDVEDPGTFAIEASEDWVACTVAVYPVAPPVEKTDSDSGTGTDVKASGNPLATLTKSESGLGIESLGSKVFAAAETGSGADAKASGNPLVTFPVRSDSGLGSEAPSKKGYIVYDSGSGIESAIATPPSATKIPYHDFVYKEDATRIINKVVIVGDSTIPIVRTIEDEASYAKFGNVWYEAKIVDENIDTNAWADMVGLAAVIEFGNEKVSGRATINQEGLVVGQKVRIVNSSRDIDDYFLVQALTLKILGGEVESVIVEFGDYQPDLAGLLRQIQALQQKESLVIE